MNKLISSILASSLLVGALSANDIVIPLNYDTQFAKMNNYFNTMIEKHLNNAALSNMVYPRTNIKENESSYVYQFDLAGVPKKNIKLSINDNKVLTLEGEKKNFQENNSSGVLQQEIFYGSFKKSIKLPENIDENSLTTKFDNGILSVTIKKIKIKKPKAKIIPIK